MRRKWFALSGTILFSLTLLTVLALVVGASLAQQPQGPWLAVEVSVSPAEIPVGDAFLTTLVLRNEGTEAATVDEVTVELPDGVVYVGQAVGSDVADSPQLGQSQIGWAGPFTVPAGAELQIRFAAVASSQAAPGQSAVRAVALSGEQSLNAESALALLPQEALEPSLVQPVQVERVAAAPGDVQVGKTADPDLVEADNLVPVAYTVTFSNTGSSDVTLDTIRDVLPAPFQFVRLAFGSDISVEPRDQDEPEIVWDEWDGNPPVVPAGGTLVLRYWVRIPPETAASSTAYTNQVTASSGSSTIGPAYADVTIEGPEAPSFVVTKAVSPDEVAAGETVTYTVTFSNEGTGDGVLATISDTLPADFKFLGMGDGSDLDDPTSESGPIVWAKELTVPAGESRQLVYRVQADGLGLQTNQIEAVTRDGDTVGPESVAVRVGDTVRVFLPLVMRQELPPTTLPFEDTFNQGLSSDWVVFLNYPGLSADSWYWYGDAPTWGRYVHDFEENPVPSNYALSMYLGPGSQDWTDYEVVTRMKNTREKIAGLWVRGTYEERTDNLGGRVGGYYVWMKPGEGRVMLARISAVSQQYHQYDDPLLANAPAPELGTKGWFDLKVRVDGTNIKVWLKKDNDATYGAPRIDVNDGTYLHGTVGFSAWKTAVLYEDIKVTPLTASGQ